MNIDVHEKITMIMVGALFVASLSLLVVTIEHATRPSYLDCLRKAHEPMNDIVATEIVAFCKAKYGAK